MLMIMVYYIKIMQIKISKGKRHIGQSPGEVSYCSLPVESRGLILPAIMCENMYRVFPTREAHPSLGVQSFYQGSVIQAPVWLILAIQSPAPCRPFSGQVQYDPGPMQIKTGIQHKSDCYHKLPGMAEAHSMQRYSCLAVYSLDLQEPKSWSRASTEALRSVHPEPAALTLYPMSWENQIH